MFDEPQQGTGLMTLFGGLTHQMDDNMEVEEDNDAEQYGIRGHKDLLRSRWSQRPRCRITRISTLNSLQIYYCEWTQNNLTIVIEKLFIVSNF